MFRFFVNRPIFAIVIAILMILIGTIAIIMLPIAQYPEIVPPQVQVSSQYVGSGAQSVANDVTLPLERGINGVEGMLYMSSNSTNNGNSVINVTFEIGYPLDIAAVNVLNKVNPTMPLLPLTVVENGVVINKVSTNLLLVVSLLSPNHTYDSKYLGNYADIQIADAINRIPGVGELINFGLHKYSMRIWLNPKKMASLGITTSDIVDAIKDQNIDGAAGMIGAPPAVKGQVFQYQINAKSRLDQVAEFENIVVRAKPNGKLVRIRNLGRIELGSEDYSSNSMFNGQATASLGIFQRPGANALKVAQKVGEVMKSLSSHFPKDMKYTIAYDTTKFVKASLKEVVVTLFEAMFLVFLVVFVFLQNWRAVIIPSIAIPVSLIGAFTLLLVFGFSINTLSLLGLVLAIGLVVDDAIVVVENVVRRMDSGDQSIKEATIAAMEEVKGPIVTTTLILMAVFVPMAFIPGMSGRLYNQFALTIAFAVGLSGINSLTLSPALCALILKRKTKEPWFAFRWFNKGFDAFAEAYKNAVPKFSKYWLLILAVFITAIVLTALLFKILPTAFIPSEDQGFFIVTTQLPDASSVQRTTTVNSKVFTILKAIPGVENVITINGYNFIQGVNQSNVGVTFAILKPWGQRKTKALQLKTIMGKAKAQFDQIKGARIMGLNPPAIPGLGVTGGFNFELQDIGHKGVYALADAVDQFIDAANQQPELTDLFTNYSVDAPQLKLSINREKAKAMGVSVASIMSTLQAYLGSLYVNEFTKFGHTYKVIIQANKNARANKTDINQLYVRNNDGQMVPLGALVKTEKITGPFNVPHYNIYTSALITGHAAPGYSSGQAIKAMEKLAKKTLPDGMGYKWTGLSLQQIEAGHIAPIIFLLSLVFVFLFLAALYESWSMPFMVLLAVPLALLGAGLALWLRGLQLDVYAQIGLVMLIGLAAKNAILIVEFAKQKREQGATVIEAAMSAARLRLRPILMTAFAFIFGVAPLAMATGAGANSRHSIGTTVIGGMLVSTILSLIIVPVFYVLIETLREKKSRKPR